jgi:non-ribosomal peptide synthetase-like protein
VGNSALLPPGAALGGGVLIGVLSSVPGADGETVPDGTSWLGSPAIHLPARLKAHGFSEEQTYKPPRRLVALRLFIEFFRIILPSTIFVVLASLIMNATDILQDYIELWHWLALVPLLYIGTGALAVLAALLLKELLIGRYTTGVKPLWCDFVWRSELVTGVYENLAVMFFLDLLRGTPFIAFVLRRFGLKAGRRCYIDSTWFTEFDLVELGDDAALNENANIQTHLFEDRVMKMGTVRIGRRCAVGTMSTVLYDTEMKDGAALGDLSLLMKGETLPAGTRWHGIPSKSAAT